MDSGNSRCQVLNSDLAFFNTFGRTGSGKGQFQDPRSEVLPVTALGRCMWLTVVTIVSKSSPLKGYS